MSMEVWRKTRASSRRRKCVHPLLDKHPVAHGAKGDDSGSRTMTVALCQRDG
ncbi:hypothetical protein GRI58_13165 [Porphyrobacter algicida]|uniref:Uncharacterized protein n=1 Tax=Qipengyuania algicida TaxID=1836209 RepID=A0A845AS95_9SPHN|nr:hypothetical protein [Qipengyuania algicida]MXP29758.1 hypothetical protein [Qipengyuania algicida]